MRFLWSFVHNCVAHPLLWLTGHSKWATRLHDYSGEKAYPASEC